MLMRFFGLRASSSDPEALPVPLRLSARLPDDPAVRQRTQSNAVNSTVRLSYCRQWYYHICSALSASLAAVDRASLGRLDWTLGCVYRSAHRSRQLHRHQQLHKHSSHCFHALHHGKACMLAGDPVRAKRIAARLALPTNLDP
jgi:hypothetical protein